jgi:hypothetical protein
MWKYFLQHFVKHSTVEPEHFLESISIKVIHLLKHKTSPTFVIPLLIKENNATASLLLNIRHDKAWLPHLATVATGNGFDEGNITSIAINIIIHDEKIVTRKKVKCTAMLLLPAGQVFHASLRRPYMFSTYGIMQVPPSSYRMK